MYVWHTSVPGKKISWTILPNICLHEAPPDMLCPCLGVPQTDYTQKTVRAPLHKQLPPHRGATMAPLRLSAFPGELCPITDNLGVDTVMRLEEAT